MCGLVMDFTIEIPFHIEMLRIKSGYMWPCCFKKEVKNVKRISHDHGRRPMAIFIGHQVVSGDLKKAQCVSTVSNQLGKIADYCWSC